MAFVACTVMFVEQLITGGVRSTTAMVKELVFVRPLGSSTRQTTTFVPSLIVAAVGQGLQLARCHPMWRSPARFETVSLMRAVALAKTMLANRSYTGKITVNEPDAKVILPEPRSVQKANSYQFNKQMKTQCPYQISPTCKRTSVFPI